MPNYDVQYYQAGITTPVCAGTLSACSPEAASASIAARLTNETDPILVVALPGEVNYLIPLRTIVRVRVKPAAARTRKLLQGNEDRSYDRVLPYPYFRIPSSATHVNQGGT